MRSRLLGWYRKHARDLPWRRTRDPYAVWVSEVMLQQTRVDTVIPFYERFLIRFPNVFALARASEDDVMAHWSGLGYYRRARLLHRGAKDVVQKHGGSVPRSPAGRLSLPGVGRYTAGAIGSIAFGLREPVVDGNVARVLARVFGIRAPIGTPRVEARLWKDATDLVQTRHPGNLNQALMELGATCCTPVHPECPRCPVASLCVASARGLTQSIPVVRERRPPKVVECVAVVARAPRANHVWLVRAEGSLFGGTWVVPMAEGVNPMMALDAAKIRGTRRSLVSCGRVRHVLTHRQLEVTVFTIEGARAASSRGRRAVSVDDLASLGISTLTRKVLAAGQSRRPCF